jgi:ADP-ribose pyrophosphatase YjhB (NUDIX family)
VDRPVSERQLLRWSESLAAIARTGLGFTESLYERERFEEVLRVAADISVAAASGSDGVEDADHLVEEWMRAVGQGVPGYVTPKVAVGAAVGNDKGELLLVKRADSGVWLYPTGWADVGYSAAEVVVKEVLEETGIEAEVVRLIAVLDGLRLGFTRVPLYSLVFHCRALGGKLQPPTPSSVPTWAGSRPTTSPNLWSGPSAGVPMSSPPCAANISTSSSTVPASPCGAGRLPRKSAPTSDPGRLLWAGRRGPIWRPPEDLSVCAPRRRGCRSIQPPMT